MNDTQEVDGCGRRLIACEYETFVFAQLMGSREASVSFRDIAMTLDGGDPTSSSKESNRGLLRCGDGGGHMGVLVDARSSLYRTEEFKEKDLRPGGILISVIGRPPGSKTCEQMCMDGAKA
ncbi:hypothetical protein CP532_4621 [Ophiocordyceps camponoti-leonardi (nom. inval.)]|nr:hypothetical protein CP532_4621 [Ophiocordyceps camponoti-leonardi (nom. inval.)]